MKIALFDFDGTLTRHDTLFGFIVFTCGPACVAKYFLGIVRILFLLKIGMYTAAQGKERILALFFRGWTREMLSDAGRRYAMALCHRGFRRGALEAVREAQCNGRRAVIVSVSAEEWIAPVAERLGMDCICTRLAYDAAGRFSGHLEGANCNGQEKVRRLQERFPDAEWERAEVFGDSEGDIPMLSLATRGTVHYRPFRSPWLLLFELARPRQWVKNFFVFLPAFFSGRLFEPAVFVFSLLCFLAFSFCASSIYMLNDLKDCAEDRNHPTKKYRPLARGALLPSWTLGGAAVCMAGGLLLPPAWAVCVRFVLLPIFF